MKHKIFVLIILNILGLQFLKAQNTFSKVFDLETEETIIGQEIVEYIDHLYVVCGKTCVNPQRQCGELLKLDFDGNIIWRKQIGSFDIGNTNALWIKNDTITITGHRNSANQPFQFYLQQLTTSGDSIRTFTYPVDTAIVANAVNFGSASINKKFYLYGAGNGLDGSVDAILMQLSSQGELENTVYWDDGFKEMHPADLQVRSDGSLILMCEIENFENSSKRRTILNLDDSLNRNYLWTSPVAQNFGVLNNFISLENNNLAILAPNTIPALSHQAPLIHFINSTNTEFAIYEFDFESGIDLQRFTTNFIKATNGDLIGIGHYWQVGNEWSAYLYRISKEGNFLWETYYRSEDWQNGTQLNNQLLDIVELEDGSFVAVGWQDETTINNFPLRDLWVLRISADGCLHETNCNSGQFTTSSSNIVKADNKSSILCYPNPNNGVLEFSDQVIHNSRLEIYSSSGALLKHYDSISPNRKIYLKDLNSGIVILKFISPDLNFNYQRIVIR